MARQAGGPGVTLDPSVDLGLAVGAAAVAVRGVAVITLLPRVHHPIAAQARADALAGLEAVEVEEQVGAQSVPGANPGVLEVGIADRTIKIGDVICFELAYDDTVYSALTGGAQLLLVQSNNATYGGTGQIEQQFAITRARAMEARREIAVATTNSVSGFIDAQGRVLTRTEEFTASSTVVSMPLRSQITPAIWLAPWIDRLLAALGLLACVLASLRGSRRRDPAVRQDGAEPGSERAETAAQVTVSS